MHALRSVVSIRWILNTDIPAVMAVESCSYKQPWSRETFCQCLNRNNCVGLLAEMGDEVVGFLIYEEFKKRVQILNVAVHPHFRKRGVAAALLERLKEQFAHGAKDRLVAEVRESNLVAQLFFRAMGFRAIETLNQYFDDTGEDGYQFEYWIVEEN